MIVNLQSFYSPNILCNNNNILEGGIKAKYFGILLIIVIGIVLTILQQLRFNNKFKFKTIINLIKQTNIAVNVSIHRICNIFFFYFHPIIVFLFFFCLHWYDELILITEVKFTAKFYENRKIYFFLNFSHPCLCVYISGYVILIELSRNHL